jgi:serine/threonine protein phosphatase PrpC
MKATGKTDTGRKRKKNEDKFLVDSETGLLIVADGMGGHESGEVASQLAVDLTSEQFKLALRTGTVPIPKHVLHRDDLHPRTLLLGDCVKFSNQAIFEAGSRTKDETKRMGTTLVAALWLQDRIAVAHVGDSRLYIIRDGDITQCTSDHSFIQEQMDRGLLNREEAEKSDLRNMLTRSVGVRDDVEVDLKEIDVHKGDYVLLCSDGLTKMLDDDQIAAIVVDKKEPEAISEELVRHANDAGGHDNVTVVVAKIEGSPSITAAVKGLLYG